MSNCTNHEFYFMDNGCMPLRNKSMTLMRFCGFSHHGYRFFAVALNDALPSSSLQQQILHIRFGWRLTFPLLWRLTLPSLWRLFSNCHSERGKHALWERRETGQWHGVKNLLPWWRLIAFLTMVTDSSLSLRMTPYHGCYFIGRPESG